MGMTGLHHAHMSGIPLERVGFFLVAVFTLVSAAIGGTAYYSLIDSYEKAQAEGLLPIGLANAARVIRPVAMDTPITLADVEIKPSTVFSLRQLQDQWSQGAIAEAELLVAIDQLATD